MTYHDHLLKAYEGELIGRVFFNELAKSAATPAAARKLEFLAGIEVRTARVMAPLISRYGLQPRSADNLDAQGRRDAAKYAGLPWDVMNARFVAEFPPYVDEFLDAEAAAPATDLRVMQLVTAHEVALIAFSKEEAAGGDGGMAQLQVYLTQLDAYERTVAAAAAVIVRPVQPADEARWRELFNGYIAFYRESVPQEVIDFTWQRVVAGQDGMAGLVAVDASGAVVGLANLVFHASTWSATSYCYLEDLFADPTVRNQGVGRALIDATYALADARGASRTYWMTQETNVTARRLYDRAGVLTPFVQYKR